MRRITVLLAALLMLSPVLMQAQREAMRVYREAETLREQNKFETAIDRYNEAIRADPTNYRYYLQRGRCEYRLNRLPAAQASLEQAIALGEEEIPASVYYLMGKIQLTQNPDNLGEAVKYYRLAADQEVDDTRRLQYQLLLVQSLINLGQYSEASTYLDDVATAAPNNVSVLYYQGKLAAAQGEHPQAQTYFEQALRSTALREASPEERAKYYYGLGQALEALGRDEEAITAYEQANHGAISALVQKKIQPVTPASQYKLAVSYFLGEEYGRSREFINQLLASDPNNANAYVLLARIAQEENDLRSAIQSLERAASYEPDSTEKAKIYMQLADIHDANNDYRSALTTAQRAIDADIRSLASSKLLLVKARAEYHTGEYGAAVSTYDRILNAPRLDARTKARINFMMGMAAKNAGDIETAHNAFERASYGPYQPAAEQELNALRR